jgi:hypothetical protein
MARALRHGLPLCILLGFWTAAPASAQDAAATIAKAQQTLTEILRLLDALQARQAIRGAAPNARAGNATARPAPPEDNGWKSLFDGQSLASWKRTDFSGGGNIHVEKSFRGGLPAIVVEAGTTLSGLNWTNEVPKTDYEMTLEAMKIEGSDFMCGLTFPVGDSHASLILGGWGGTVVGISSIDNRDASENETTRFLTFPKDRWFVIRLRVTPAKIEAWLDDRKIVDQDITGRKISLRFGEIAKSVPLGLATYQTTSAFRSIKLRRITVSTRKV